MPDLCAAGAVGCPRGLAEGLVGGLVDMGADEAQGSFQCFSFQFSDGCGVAGPGSRMSPGAGERVDLCQVKRDGRACLWDAARCGLCAVGCGFLADWALFRIWFRAVSIRRGRRCLWWGWRLCRHSSGGCAAVSVRRALLTEALSAECCQGNLRVASLCREASSTPGERRAASRESQRR